MSERVHRVDGAAVDEADLLVDPDQASDAHLLRGCRQGHADSWELLVHRYERLVYSVATRCGLRAADAADVVQATFLALLDARDLHDTDRLAAWLTTVARRKSWRLLNKTSREIPTAQLPETRVKPLPWEDVIVLHEALLRIEEPCRSLLLSLYFDPERPSYQQIAERLERSPSGIGPLRGRCLERLRVLLSEGEA